MVSRFLDWERSLLGEHAGGLEKSCGEESVPTALFSAGIPQPLLMGTQEGTWEKDSKALTLFL